MSKKSLSDYIELFNHTHNSKYSYDKISYIRCHSKITITCPIHGDFKKTPHDHLDKRRPQGCPKCSLNNTRMSFDNFIKKANKIHNNKYIYNENDYVNSRTEIQIFCKQHGSFLQTPTSHLQKHGCSKCGDIRTATSLRLSNNEFLQRAKFIHNDKYEYPDMYINSRTKVKIVCKKHGEFKQTASSHLSGKGCYKCASTSSFGENKIREILSNKNIYFHEQYRFNECKGIKNKLPFDFYLPDHNICIEYDGRQHFTPVYFFGGIDNYNKTILNDKIKNDFCLKNKITLIRISYKEYKNIKEIICKYVTY